MPTETLRFRSAIPASAAELYAWHGRPGAFLRLQPPWERLRAVSQEGRFGTDGFRVTFQAAAWGPFRRTWVVEFFDFEPDRGFKYRQLQGPFAEWVHSHRFLPDGENSAFLENEIAYRLPLGPIGAAFSAGMVEDRIRALFGYRHAITASDLRRHGLDRDRPRWTVAITGSHGLIGSELALFLATGGHDVVRLVSGVGRVARPAFADGTRSLGWNPQAPVDAAVFAGVDAVIHLAADAIADGRWNAAKRNRILESRTVPTRHIAEAIAALPEARRPKVLVSASAVGIYGERGDELLTEDSSAGAGFLADVCRQWEAATAPASDAGVRVVHVRIGVALTPRGGALGKQLPAFRAGLGATLGTGRQWVPWITVNDVVGAIHHALRTESLQGAVNVMAPHAVNNRAFGKTLGRVLGRPVFFWLPRFALHALFGDIADAVLLSSMHGYPKKLLDSGFAFEHQELEGGLRFLLGK
jgi:uncharacterized protein (TIGR01777 family)